MFAFSVVLYSGQLAFKIQENYLKRGASTYYKGRRGVVNGPELKGKTNPYLISVKLTWRRALCIFLFFVLFDCCVIFPFNMEKKRSVSPAKNPFLMYSAYNMRIARVILCRYVSISC